MWVVSAIHEKDGNVMQIPTFFLHESVQGTLYENEAERLARDIIDPRGSLGGNLHISAVEV